MMSQILVTKLQLTICQLLFEMKKSNSSSCIDLTNLLNHYFHCYNNFKRKHHYLNLFINSSQEIKRQSHQYLIYIRVYQNQFFILPMEPEKKQLTSKTSDALTEIYTHKKHAKSKKYKINTSRSRGELKLLKMLIKENNWVEVFKSGDLMWSGLAIPDQDVDIATELSVNRIPAMPHLCHKRTMGYILNKFRQYWPEEYWFYPKTYLLPEDEERLVKKLSHGGTFIAKPSVGCQGDGIILIKKINDIPKIGNSQWIVQPYIDNPLLIQNKKFDFRLYVMIASIDPYICYLNQEGLARFCTEDYQKPTKENFKNSFVHLTNYSLNKNSPKFINSDQPFGRGTKRCLGSIWEDLIAQGVDVGTLKERIIEVTQKFLIGIYPFIKYYYNATFPKKNGKNFHVLGIDILVDEHLNPWLLEANNNPSFNIEHEVNQLVGSKVEIRKEVSPVDEYVKRIVVEDSIFIGMRGIQKQKEMAIGQNYYSYKKILDAESDELREMNIIENMLKLFHSQCGIRSKWVLTASQFSKLAKLNGMTNEKITKNDYHLVFIKIMREKFNPNQMEFQDFIEAIEYIVKQVVGYTKENKLAVMQQHMDFLVGQL